MGKKRLNVGERGNEKLFSDKGGMSLVLVIINKWKGFLRGQDLDRCQSSCIHDAFTCFLKQREV